MWHTLLYQPLLNALFLFYRLFNNFGLSIIAMTFLLRLALMPLTLPSLKASRKIKELTSEINKLKKKHGKNKQAFSKAQLELYKKHGVNPAAGCLPQIIQLLVLIAFFQAFNQVLQANGDIVANLNEVLYSFLRFSPGAMINTRFLYLELTQPDTFVLGSIKLPGLFLVGSALAQFFSSKLMSPALSGAEKLAKKTPGESDDMAVTMQKQMTYMLPFMTILVGFNFPSGLVLYWLVFSLTNLAQHLWLNKKKK